MLCLILAVKIKDTFPSINCDPFNSSRTFPNVIILPYINWIYKITQLAYLNVIRYGQDLNPSRKYPNILPRWNCGNVVMNRTILSVYNFPWMVYIVHFDKIWELTVQRTSEGTLISHRYVLCLAKPLILGLP